MREESPNKIKKPKNIFDEISYKGPFKWKNIKDFKFEDDDIISMGYDEGFYTENNSMDPHYFVRISRMVEETDKEFRDRIKSNELQKKWAKEERHKSYLRLKKEFEPAETED